MQADHSEDAHGKLERGGAANYGAAANVAKHAAEKVPFLVAQRRRMNLLAIILSLFLPWLIHVCVICVMSFKIRYAMPVLAYVILGLCVVVVLIFGGFAVHGTWQKTSKGYHAPMWYIFVFITSLLGLIAAVGVGNQVYQNSTAPYYQSSELNTYKGIDPSRMRGAQLMDVGAIYFTPDTKLDLLKTMGFKDGKMYCVAPVTSGSTAPQSYDFWVVGTDCCSGPPRIGEARSYHCGAWNQPNASSGVRLLDDADRAFYRLAVQQAEAAYNIKAVHPLFFTWSTDALGTGAGGAAGAAGAAGASTGAGAGVGGERGANSIAAGYNRGANFVYIDILVSSLIQSLFTLVATLGFSTLGAPA